VKPEIRAVCYAGNPNFRFLSGGKAARELGINTDTLYGWNKAAREGRLELGPGAQSPDGAMSLSKEIQKLRQETRAQASEIYKDKAIFPTDDSIRKATYMCTKEISKEVDDACEGLGACVFAFHVCAALGGGVDLLRQLCNAPGQRRLFFVIARSQKGKLAVRDFTQSVVLRRYLSRTIFCLPKIGRDTENSPPVFYISIIFC